MTVSVVRQKVALLGDASVGKTSLIRRYVVDRFSDEYITTIGAKVSRKTLRLQVEGREVDLNLLIWDILGQKGYASLQESAFNSAKGVFLVFDLTRPETQESLKTYWLDRVRSIGGPVPGLVVGNKVDLVSSRPEAQRAVEDVAESFGTLGLVSSAKTGENVQEAFAILGKAVLASSGKATGDEREPRSISVG